MVIFLFNANQPHKKKNRKIVQSFIMYRPLAGLQGHWSLGLTELIVLPPDGAIRPSVLR